MTDGQKGFLVETALGKLPAIMTVDEAANLLKMSRRAVERMLKNGVLRGARFPSRTRFEGEEGVKHRDVWRVPAVEVVRHFLGEAAGSSMKPEPAPVPAPEPAPAPAVIPRPKAPARRSGHRSFEDAVLVRRPAA